MPLAQWALGKVRLVEIAIFADFAHGCKGTVGASALNPCLIHTLAQACPGTAVGAAPVCRRLLCNCKQSAGKVRSTWERLFIRLQEKLYVYRSPVSSNHQHLNGSAELSEAPRESGVEPIVFCKTWA